MTDFDLTHKLNSAQLAAVSQLEGPQLILAGAGSGKTRVLTFKIAALLHYTHANSNQIMAVTFTNKAAGEMRQRMTTLLDRPIELRWLGTFHSVCAKMLRMYGERLGYSSNFTIYDREDQKRVIKKLLKEHREEDLPPDLLKNKISAYKNKNIFPDEARRDAQGGEDEKIAIYYDKYQQTLSTNNAMDFDDLICQTSRLLSTDQEIREKFKSQLKYILIDEFQDTNRAQFQLIQLLLGSHRNLTVVGDDDQSIYGWRGADINNILTFNRLYPGVHVVKLEQNYRSTKNILGIASSVIHRNSQRMDKSLWTDNGEGNLIPVRENETDIAEAEWIVGEILKNGPEQYKSTAVFYRTNSQSRVLEDQLRRNNIPYLLLGSIRFYDRKEIKDILAYLQVLNNPRDSVSLGRIINVPKRGIGDKSVEAFADHALKNGLPLYNALEQWEQLPLSTGLSRKISGFLKLIDDLKKDSGSLTVSELIDAVIEKSGYRDFLEGESTSESWDRLSNIEELVSAAEDFEERSEASELKDFLQEISLFTQMDQSNTAGAVMLMTVHSSKGLEFPRVFIAGLEDGLFPLTRSGEDEDIEEERRLFYVAVTRAERELFLTYASYRRVWGNVTYNTPSRFLKEVDPKFLSVPDPGRLSGKPRGRYYEPLEEGFSAPYDEGSQESDVRVGQGVSHAKFGPGKIIKIEGAGEGLKLLIAFRGGIPRRMVLKFAKLKFLD